MTLLLVALQQTPVSQTGVATMECCFISIVQCTLLSTDIQNMASISGCWPSVFVCPVEITPHRNCRGAEGDRNSTLGYVDQLRESFVPEDRSRGVFFDQDWGSMPVFAVASVVSTSGTCQPWSLSLVMIGIAMVAGRRVTPGECRGAAANRVALEACVKARNEGRHLERESRDILMSAAQSNPELAIALETWKEIKFEFDTVDKLDV